MIVNRNKTRITKMQQEISATEMFLGLFKYLTYAPQFSHTSQIFGRMCNQ